MKVNLEGNDRVGTATKQGLAKTLMGSAGSAFRLGPSRVPGGRDRDNGKEEAALHTGTVTHFEGLTETLSPGQIKCRAAALPSNTRRCTLFICFSGHLLPG